MLKPVKEGQTLSREAGERPAMGRRGCALQGRGREAPGAGLPPEAYLQGPDTDGGSPTSHPRSTPLVHSPLPQGLAQHCPQELFHLQTFHPCLTQLRPCLSVRKWLQAVVLVQPPTYNLAPILPGDDLSSLLSPLSIPAALLFRQKLLMVAQSHCRPVPCVTECRCFPRLDFDATCLRVAAPFVPRDPTGSQGFTFYLCYNSQFRSPAPTSSLKARLNPVALSQI